MNTAKSEVASMLETLPDDSSLEDIQYHPYVLEKLNVEWNELSQREHSHIQKQNSDSGNGSTTKVVT